MKRDTPLPYFCGRQNEVPASLYRFIQSGPSFVHVVNFCWAAAKLCQIAVPQNARRRRLVANRKAEESGP
jgi:Ni,Fe-hydrogenase III large subunit